MKHIKCTYEKERVGEELVEEVGSRVHGCSDSGGERAPAWTVCCVWPEPYSESSLSSARRRGFSNREESTRRLRPNWRQSRPSLVRPLCPLHLQLVAVRLS